MTSAHYDMIVVGSGPEAIFPARRLESTGKPILLLERGDYQPRAQARWRSAVHGQRGEYPNGLPPSTAFPFLPVPHEPYVQKSNDGSKAAGLHPLHLPLGIKLDEKGGRAIPTIVCIRCNALDGVPCLPNGKADAQVMCVDPALAAHPNLTLLTDAYVSRLETDAAGHMVTGVQVMHGGEQ